MGQGSPSMSALREITATLQCDPQSSAHCIYTLLITRTRTGGAGGGGLHPVAVADGDAGLLRQVEDPQ